MSLKENILKNGIASASQRVIRIGEQLLLVPFFISAWGAAYYGEWLTLTIIPTILGFSDLGFGSAASNSFILKYAAGDKQGAANIAKSGFVSITFIVFFSILLTILLIFSLSYFHILDNSLITKQDAVLSVSFLMFSRIIGFYTQLFEAYFRAARRASLGMILQSINSGSILLGSLIVLLNDGNIVQFAFTTLIITIVFVFTFCVIAKKILPINKEAKGVILISEIKAIFHKGLGYLLSPIWTAIFFQGTTFVVRIALGPVAVTIFNTVRTLTRSVNQANAVLITSLLPDLQFEIGAGNFQQARKIFRFGLICIILVAIIGMIFLFLGGTWFYEIWTRKELNPPLFLWIFFISGILFNAIWWMSSDILIAVNKPYDFTIAGLITSIVTVLITYFLSINFGLSGAAIGCLFLEIVLSLYVLPKSCKLINQPINRLFRDIITDCINMKKSKK